MEPHSTPKKFLDSEEKFDHHLYRQLIGILMQLPTWTKSDMSYSVSILFKNTPIFSDNSSAGKIASSIESIA
jgi:hypothetical protein